MTRPRGPRGGDGGQGGDGSDGGVPRQRTGQGGSSASISESHQMITQAATAGRPGNSASRNSGPAGATPRNGEPAGTNPRDGESPQTPETDSPPPLPQNDATLKKDDPQTLEQIEAARVRVRQRLQELSDEAWDHVDTNRDSILAQEGYQRQREKMIEGGMREEVADLVVERTAMGTEAHRHLDNSVTNEAATMLPPETGFRLRSEVGFDADGVETSRVKDQEFRPDVILERQYQPSADDKAEWEVAHAYDLKTGLKTGIAPGWATRVTEALNLPNRPEELRPTQRPLSTD
ncbi:hypothetical protein [Melissospora conviva]|uniref:hypothetical protein n=1 Tax=Melissospora conviva TaxID=3388432 RepID=UPI003B7D7C62